MRMLARLLGVGALMAGCAAGGPSPGPDDGTGPAGTGGGVPAMAVDRADGAEPATPPAELQALASPGASSDEARAAAAAGRRFALDLYGVLRREPGNLAFSPASIAAALAMVWAGAAGSTAAEMAAVLHLDDLDPAAAHAALGGLLAAWESAESPGVTLRVANRLFGDGKTRFEEPFLAVARDRYRSPLETVDFRAAPEAARKRVNDWVEARTEERILDLLPPGSVDPDTRLILANAIYFKGSWRSRFPEAATRPEPFYPSHGGPKQAPTMRQRATFGYAEVDGVRILEMPYEGDDLAMVVLLPERRDGLGDLEARLTPDAMDRWTGALRQREVRLWLPRFRLEPAAAVRLKPVLGSLGLRLAFGRDADFTPMSPERPLYLDNVYHKAFVEVNEEGTEAAAATAAVMTTEAAPIAEPPEFRADHPFLFLIRDLRNGAVLFLGRLEDPAA